jgi:hypothetical protein
MQVPVNINNKKLSIKAWSIKDEKEALLEAQENFTTKQKIDFFFKKLIGSYNLTNQEKLYCLLDLKSKIATDNFDISYTCDNCRQKTEANINVEEALSINYNDYAVVNFSDYSIKLEYAESLEESVYCINKIYDLATIFNQEEIKDFLESMDIDDYDLLSYEYSKLNKPFVFEGKGRCLICGHEVTYAPSDEDLINTITSISLMEYYPLIANLKSHGFLISEIDNFLPFELEMMISVLKKQNTQNQGKSNG